MVILGYKVYGHYPLTKITNDNGVWCIIKNAAYLLSFYFYFCFLNQSSAIFFNVNKIAVAMVYDVFQKNEKNECLFCLIIKIILSIELSIQINMHGLYLVANFTSNSVPYGRIYVTAQRTE